MRVSSLHDRNYHCSILTATLLTVTSAVLAQPLVAQTVAKGTSFTEIDSLIGEGSKHLLHGDLDDSLTAYTSALDYARSKFGPGHWSTVIPAHRIEVVKAAIAGDDGQRLDLDRACVAWRQWMLADLRGDDEKAKLAAEDALRLCRRSILRGTLFEANLLGELSGYYKKSRQYKEKADAQYSQLTLYKEIAGSIHPETITARLNYAGAAMPTDRIYEGEAELQRVLIDLHELTKSPHDESVAAQIRQTCYDRLGSYHNLFGRPREAIGCYQKALSTMVEEPRTKDVPRELALRSLMSMKLAELGLHPEAAAEMGRVLSLLEQSDADTANEEVAMLLRAGRVAYLAGSVPEEAKYVAQAQQVAAKQKEDEVPSESFDPALATLYTHQAEYDKAAVHGHRWLKLVQRLFGNQHPFAIEPLQAVIEIETALGHSKEASELRRMLQKIESDIALYEEARLKRLNSKSEEQPASGN